MGADLYIEKLRKPVENEWRPKLDEARSLLDAAMDDVAKASAKKLFDEAYERLYGEEHYFRDSYNGTSVLRQIGLSWWRDMEYDVQDEDSDINVSPAACQRFLAKVLAAGEVKPLTDAELKAKHLVVEAEGENSPESWNKYFTEKRERLIAFLKRAIDNGGMFASC